ncbi:MAG: type II secretion system F family protein [Candidatus Diapherotrites archaeon]|nr:type II secretion system F family protein [Candidatus Diapherotrites archaeon]
MGIYQDYRKAVKYVNPSLEADFVIGVAMFASAVALMYLGLFVDLVLGGLVAIMVFDVALGYPMFMRDKRITQIETTLPDVLSHMSTSLRAGATVESALKEVAGSGYGPISIDLRNMLREINEGKTFEEAFLDFGRRTESITVQRSVNVIVSAKRTGGGLVDALSSIADDMRQNMRLFKERRAKTMVQVLFIVIAANFVGPFIFGLVAGIILFLASISGEPPALFGTLIFYFKGYLVVSALFSALAASMIREGNVTKTVIYAPVLLVISYVIFVAVNYMANAFFVV